MEEDFPEKNTHYINEFYGTTDGTTVRGYKTPQEIMQERIEDGTFRWVTKPAYLDEPGLTIRPRPIVPTQGPIQQMPEWKPEYYNYDLWADER